MHGHAYSHTWERSNTHWTLSQGHRRQEPWTHLCVSSPFSPYLLVEPVIRQKVDELLSVVGSHIDMLASCLQLHQLAVQEIRRVLSTAREEQWYISFQRLCVQALAIGVTAYPLHTPQCGSYPTCVSPRSLLTTVKLRASSSTLSYCFINRRCLQWRRQVGWQEGRMHYICVPLATAQQGCHTSITWVSHGCHNPITWVSHAHHMSVSHAHHVSHTDHITWVSYAHHIGGTCPSHGCHTSITWVSHGCHNPITWVSHAHHMSVSHAHHVSHTDHITWVSYAHHIGGTCPSHGCHMSITWVPHTDHITSLSQGGTCPSHGCNMPIT